MNIHKCFGLTDGSDDIYILCIYIYICVYQLKMSQAVPSTFPTGSFHLKCYDVCGKTLSAILDNLWLTRRSQIFTYQEAGMPSKWKKLTNTSSKKTFLTSLNCSQSWPRWQIVSWWSGHMIKRTSPISPFFNTWNYNSDNANVSC